ncbi:MAG: 30S ribosomal protein S4 [Thermoplasmataceae archaeon]|jgi:small subunit ribosomal protein S4
MGDPKFSKKTYSTPRHPWEKERIDAEKEILIRYGLKNKRELWKGMAMLDSMRTQARQLQAKIRTNDPASMKQLNALTTRLERYNISKNTGSLDDILSLNLDNVLERRLQTIVYRKSLAKTINQARQLITHGHIAMNGRRVTIPGILVEQAEEDSIQYYENSVLTDELHPLRRAMVEGGNSEKSEEEEKPSEEQENASEEETQTDETANEEEVK